MATPLGSARDITLRALDILASADVLAAEDTRTARKLLLLHTLNGGTCRAVEVRFHLPVNRFARAGLYLPTQRA